MGQEKMEWECECGHIEYMSYPPEECSECWKLNSFNKRDSEEDEIDGMMGELI